MKLRRLQRLDEQAQWYDDAYAVEDHSGRITFHYNLTWDRVGSTYNRKLQESAVALEAIETVLPLGERLRWLPVEIIAEKEADAFLELLDTRCAIPKPRSIALPSPVAIG